MNTNSCPECNNENAFFTIMDESGAHYECPDCGFEWCDSSIQLCESDDLDE